MVLGAVVVIVVGVLVVNYFKDKGTTIPGLSTQSDVALESEKKIHTVSKGETLWSIAEKYLGSGFKWTEIAKENGIDESAKIEVGQVLKIPESGSIIKTKTDNPITGATYEVVKGDNLWNIAVRAYGDGYKWVEIARENKLANPNLIHAGNILTLPR